MGTIVEFFYFASGMRKKAESGNEEEATVRPALFLINNKVCSRAFSLSVSQSDYENQAISSPLVQLLEERESPIV